MKLIFDAEMTGTNEHEDELLQLSIVNEDGEVLFNEYFKPEYVFEWPKAQEITGISPETVKDAYPFSYYKNEVQKLFNQATELIGYSTPCDLAFLRVAGIQIPDVKISDVAVEFAPIYAEANNRRKVRTMKLITCAKFYGYEYDAHNSLNDALATLHCYKEIHQNDVWLNEHQTSVGVWSF